MTETQLRALIREVVSEILARPQTAAANPAGRRPNALVLFSGALLGFEAAVDSLARLRAADVVNLDWTQTPSAERILDQPRIAAIRMTPVSKSLVQGHDMLIVPTLTVNMVAKVVHGIGDDLPSNVLAEFVMSNKPVVVATNAACPDSPDKRGWFPQMPEGYAAMLRSNLATLKSFGVRLSTAEKLDQAVIKTIRGESTGTPPPAAAPTAAAAAPINCTERVITAETIWRLPAGSAVQFMPNAIITDRAKDEAKRAGIVWERRS